MNDISAILLTEIRIPFMGSVENARIQLWSAKEGARLTPDDVLCEIETDKTVMEINAPDHGILARRTVAAGADLKVGDLIGYLAPPDASPEQVARALAALDGVAEPTAAVAGVADGADTLEPPRVRVSPYARRLAQDYQLDLASVTGTGASGRITGDDVLRAATMAREPTAPAVPQAAPAPAPAGASSPAALPPGYEGIPHEVIAHSMRRRVIARRLAETASTVPHLTADVQVDMSTLLAARASYNAARKSAGQAPVSVLAFLARAACATLRDHATLNATNTETGLVVWKTINLGIAVDTPDGLVVPVIRDAGDLSIGAMDAAIKRLAERARAGSLTQQELEGGTFTLSNPGSVGPVLRAEAILNAPQVALLGFPAIQRVPVAVGSDGDGYRVEVRPVLRPSLTFDHRPLDGAAVVRFLGDYQRRLETMVFDW
jgi:pyruvate/2-oxoglutarate dehydrogenase complex dihydrolipoamide acyltransferase (E2) component